MLSNTVTNKLKKYFPVILLTILPLISNGCFTVSSQQARNDNSKNAKTSADYSAPQVVGKIDNPDITESSGIAASPCQPNVFWTHNDSGNTARIYAIDATGKTLAAFNVKNATNEDWEDIAAYKDRGGECFLFIGDIGNNARTRGDFVIYRLREPEIPANGEETKNNADESHDLAVLHSGRRLEPAADTTPRMKIYETDIAEAIKFDYPDVRHDAETLMINPQTADIYIVTKRLSGAAAVYKLTASEITNKINRLEKISDLTVPAVPNGFITGGDIAPDGKRVVLCDYFAAYEFTLPAKSKNFDDIWKVAPMKIEFGERSQGEAVGYSADGNSIFATSEKAGSPLIKVQKLKK